MEPNQPTSRVVVHTHYCQLVLYPEQRCEIRGYNCVCVDVIVCSAMEESLVGTAGQSLISDLYHGKTTNVIQCGLCGKVSEHDEDFLDLCVSVSGSSRLEDSLARMFLESEILDASNRYRCDSCGQLTDAVKRTKLRHLPPILTVSLLRFNYNPVKMERYKETGHFEFPLHLEMSCFCEAETVSDVISASKSAEHMSCGDSCSKSPTVNGFCCGDKLGLSSTVFGDSSQTHAKFHHIYELFSVVVHRGGAHGGHYHALIRDLEGRGTWSQPDRTLSSTADNTPTTSVPCPKPSPASIITKVELASPRSVITCILLESGGTACGMSVGDLADKISSLTGESWRKKYKARHGSFLKFLSDNGDLFIYDSTEGFVSLVPDFGQTGHKLEVNGISKLSPIPAHDPAPATCKKMKKPQPKRDELDISSPRSVITSILLDTGGTAGLSVTDLCSKISDVTGDSWRKYYKPKHGSLVKFLNNNSDLFVHDVSGGWVTLLASPSNEDTKSEIPEMPKINGDTSDDSLLTDVVQHPDISSTSTETKSRSKRNRKKPKTKALARESTHAYQEEQKKSKEMMSTLPEELVPKPDHCWFDFNDTTIRPVQTEDIEKHFAGKECAYMLFYRAMPTSNNCCVSKHVEIPDWLISEITTENFQLEQLRANYEEFVNVVKVELHFGRSYEYVEGVLRPRIGACYFMEHSVDIRQNASYLLQVVDEVGGELVEQCRTIHIAKSLPSGGLHLYQEVTANQASSLKSFGVTQSTKLFVWNGREIDNVAIPVGFENEPIAVRFELQSSSEIFSVAVPKNMTVFALKGMIASRLQLCSVEKVHLYQTKENGAKCVPLTSDLNKTVSEIGLYAKDRIVIQCSGSSAASKAPQSCTPGSVVKASQKTLPKQITVHCENHTGDDVVMVEVEADSAASVEELKVLIMTSADVPIELVADVRLRVRLDDLGIRGVGPPLHETVDLAAARLSDGVTLVLESGKAPQGSEIVLTVSVSASNELELTVDHDMAIHQLLHEVLLRAGVSDKMEEWHLCQSDWTGDTGAVLSEPHQTVGDAGLNHGDHLFLRAGCPPPPGFLKFFIHLESSPARPCWWDPVRDMAAAVSPSPVGSVVISKQSTLAELKQQIMAVLLHDYEIPSPQFLRLRILTSSLRPTTILRQHCQPLNKMKIGNGCTLGVEVLPLEEDLGAKQVMLTVRRRLPGERNYGDWSQEVIWDTEPGATIASLRTIIADTIGETESSIRMAKHIPDKFDWLIIPRSDDVFYPEKFAGGGVGGAKKKHKRKARNGKPGGSVCDLKSSPFNLQDGDVIGVKVADEPGGEDSDFGSVDDDTCRQKIKSEQKEMAEVREALKKSETKALAATSRVETAIKIHVDNFR